MCTTDVLVHGYYRALNSECSSGQIITSVNGCTDAAKHLTGNLPVHFGISFTRPYGCGYSGNDIHFNQNFLSTTTTYPDNWGAQRGSICSGAGPTPEPAPVCGNGNSLSLSGLGRLTCEECDIGKYNDAVNALGLRACYWCDPGQYNNKYGQMECKDCPPGWSSTNWRDTCTICPKGYSGTSYRDSCTSCPMGTYSEYTGQTRCKDCPKGTYNDQTKRTAETECKKCGAGYYVNAYQNACTDCPKGKYNGQAGRTSCTDCHSGYYAQYTKSQSCTACPKGKYNDQTKRTAETECKYCGTGKYNDQTKRTAETECKKCGTGKYNDQTKRTAETECKKCGHGKYNEQTGQKSESDACKPCLAGTYNNQMGQPSCFNCLQGRFAEAAGFRNIPGNCDPCETGKYGHLVYGSLVVPTSSAIACKNCPQGFSQSSLGTTDCEKCAQHLYQDQEGQISCKGCPSGNFGYLFDLCGTLPVSSDVVCKDCPQGYWQDTEKSANCNLCSPGRYSTSNGLSGECPQWCDPGQEQARYPISCQDCAVAKFRTNKEDKWNCKICYAGKYQDTIGQALCKNCMVGKYLPSSSVQLDDHDSPEDCKTCPVGYHASITGQYECDECGSPEYQDEEGEKDCKGCAAGRIRTTSTGCTDCVAGKHQNEPAKSMCKECPTGYKSYEEGLAQCKHCGNGQYTDAEGQSTCKKCPWRGACQHLTTIHPKTRIGVAGPWYDRKPFVGTRLTLTNMIENGENAVQTNKRLYDRDNFITIGNENVKSSCPATTRKISENECRDIHWSTGSPIVSDVETISRQVSSRNIFFEATECPLENKIYDEETCRLGGGTPGYAITNLDFYNPYNRLFYKCEQFADDQITEPGPYKNEPRGSHFAQSLVDQCNVGRTDPTSVCNIGTYWDKTACNWGKKLRVYVLSEYFISQTPCETPIQSASECVTAFDALSPQLNSDHSKVNTLGCANACGLPGPQFPPACYIRSDKQWFYNGDHSSTNCINGCVCKKKSEKFRLIKSGVECGSTDVQIGTFATLAECADACRTQVGCIFFLYGKVNRCWWEKTNSAACTEGFVVNDYNFYQLLSDGVMHKCYNGQKEVCRKKQFYKSANYYRSENICQNKVDSFNDCKDAADELGLVFSSKYKELDNGNCRYRITSKEECKAAYKKLNPSEPLLDIELDSEVILVKYKELSSDTCGGQPNYEIATKEECKTAYEQLNGREGFVDPSANSNVVLAKYIITDTYEECAYQMTSIECSHAQVNYVDPNCEGICLMNTYSSFNSDGDVVQCKIGSKFICQDPATVIFEQNICSDVAQTKFMCRDTATVTFGGNVCSNIAQTKFMCRDEAVPNGCIMHEDGHVTYKTYTYERIGDGYERIGDGYCTNFRYLPEGAYPALLEFGNSLYDTDRIKECMNRCLDAYPGSTSFYVKTSTNNKCACSSDDCSSVTTTSASAYTSFRIVRRTQEDFCAYKTGKECICQSDGLDRSQCAAATGLQLADITKKEDYGTYYRSGEICSPSDSFDNAQECKVAAEWLKTNHPTFEHLSDIVVTMNTDTVADFSGYEVRTILCNPITIEECGVAAAQMGTYLSDYWQRETTNVMNKKYYPRGCYQKNDGVVFYNDGLEGGLEACTSDSAVGCVCETGFLKLPSISKPIGCFQEGTNFYWNNPNAVGLVESVGLVEYKVKTSGKCTDDAGWGYITDLAKCMTAAKQLELSTASETVATIANNNGSPTGCLFYNNWGSERRPQLNNGASEPCGSNGYHCLCKRIPIHTLTCGEGGCVCKRNELPKGCSTYNNKAYWSDNSNENHQNQYTKVDIIPDSSFTIDSILYEIMNTSKCIQSGGISISDQEECAKIEFESFTTTWVNTDKMNPVEKWTAITSSLDGTKLTAVVFGGNIWRSSDSGTSWTIVGTEKSWSDITSSSDGKILTAVALMHGIWRSIDSGTTWTWVLKKLKLWKSITSSSDGTKLAAVVINGHIWTSVDAGSTWTEDTSVGDTKKWSLITSSHNGKILAAVVKDEYIWTSFDSGTTWTKDTSVGDTKKWISLMSSSTKLSAVTSNGDIWTTAFPCSTADNIICAMRRTCNQNNEEFKFGFEGDGFTKQCLAK